MGKVGQKLMHYLTLHCITLRTYIHTLWTSAVSSFLESDLYGLGGVWAISRTSTTCTSRPGRHVMVSFGIHTLTSLSGRSAPSAHSPANAHAWCHMPNKFLPSIISSKVRQFALFSRFHSAWSPEDGRLKGIAEKLRGPAAILFHIARYFQRSYRKTCLCLFSLGVAQVSRDMLQNAVSHWHVCVKQGTKEGYRTLWGVCWRGWESIAR